ncbi:MAG: acetylornithine deacetylase, partial [Candidatus Hydrogenedentota bacterium]
MIRWAERFIATPSVSTDGNLAIAEQAAILLQELGFAPRIEMTLHEGVEQANVVAEAGRGEDPGVLLLTHLDTVPPGDHAAWTATGGDPFRPTREGDKLFGLG